MFKFEYSKSAIWWFNIEDSTSADLVIEDGGFKISWLNFSRWSIQNLMYDKAFNIVKMIKKVNVVFGWNVCLRSSQALKYTFLGVPSVTFFVVLKNYKILKSKV